MNTTTRNMPKPPSSDVNADLQKLPIAELQYRLSSSPEGLSDAEAKKRLSQYGLNEIVEKK